MSMDALTNTTTPSFALPTPLVEQPQAFSFFQALREIENAADSLPRVGHATSPAREVFRIRQLPELSFPPATIEATQSTRDGKVQIDQRFFGLLGVSGPMPAHITELVRNRTRQQHDPALQSFLDLFHHRMASLFYRAWSSAKPTIQRDRPWDDRYSVYLAALAGYALKHSRHRDACPDETKWHFAGRHASIRRNAEGLAAIVRSITSCQAQILPFQLNSLSLPVSARTRLGCRTRPRTPIDGNSTDVTTSDVDKRTHAVATPLASSKGRKDSPHLLGAGAVLGERVAERQSTFAVRIGPMAYDSFQQWMPGTTTRKMVGAAIQNYAPIGTVARVQVVVESSDVPQVQLGKSGSLGRSAWLQSRPSSEPRSDYEFTL